MKTVENLDAFAFEQKLKDDENGVLIDVRTPMEHQQKRIPDSILVDISNPQFLSEINKLDKSKNYYIYCRSGNRSFIAGMQMLSIGFKSVSHLQPGIIGWKGEINQ
ncbi:rhodanese-like domain-containing protein [bacterium BMS3Abin03]|jgi:rhodanese-related sulfurtransferase|nr:rhodanese-like domain-containing protein [bacterium BMS3Abin03]MCG6960709.1 rhodanese-like domain-containing protein [bacterium BMS3Abin03]